MVLVWFEFVEELGCFINGQWVLKNIEIGKRGKHCLLVVQLVVALLMAGPPDNFLC
jgi:hypothetical protein